MGEGLGLGTNRVRKSNGDGQEKELKLGELPVANVDNRELVS